jgi:site-specific DNA recombinase
MLKAGKADGMVITKLDRLSRSVGDWNDLIDGHFGEKAGKRLMSVNDSIDTGAAGGRLVLNVLMSVAQWERESTGERTRDALRFKRSKGEVFNHAPFGFKVGDDGRTLVDDPAEQETLGLIRQLRGQGMPLKKIVDRLNSLNIPTKQGKAWRLTTLQRTLQAAA